MEKIEVFAVTFRSGYFNDSIFFKTHDQAKTYLNYIELFRKECDSDEFCGTDKDYFNAEIVILEKFWLYDDPENRDLPMSPFYERHDRDGDNVN